MTLRRYAPIAPSRGTQWPTDVRRKIAERDGGYCVGERAKFPPEVLERCIRVPVELDHIRVGGMGVKSRSTVDNGAQLCPFCHRWKGLNGKKARPLLIDYVNGRAADDCGHVDPNPACDGPCQRRRAS